MEQDISERQGGLARWWDSFFCEPLRRANEEAREYLNSEQSQGLDGRTISVMVIVAIILTLQHYLLVAEELYHTMRLLTDVGLGSLAVWWREQLGSPREYHFRWLLYWAIGSFVLYVFLPALVVKVGFRQSLAEYGLKVRGAFADGWVYPLMFLVVAPLILLVSKNEHFQQTYPFYDQRPGAPLWPRFWIWELFYAVQFLGLEFFFRGFMVHGLRRRFGAYGILVMTVPYCMIHFAKPMPETFGAIIAGLALGFMSLRTRSVLLGAAIHVSVAVSMDLTSLWRQGYFG